jgi:hypothetical protein
LHRERDEALVNISQPFGRVQGLGPTTSAVEWNASGEADMCFRGVTCIAGQLRQRVEQYAAAAVAEEEVRATEQAEESGEEQTGHKRPCYVNRCSPLDSQLSCGNLRRTAVTWLGTSAAAKLKTPKALGDAFEAVVGAVLVDSDFDLRQVWMAVQPYLELDKLPVMQPQVASHQPTNFNAVAMTTTQNSLLALRTPEPADHLGV